jgi:hypothetical protein
MGRSGSVSPIVSAVFGGLIGAAAGCGSTIETPVPVSPAWTAPADWSVVSAATGDLQLTLPPWLIPFDRSGAIFANEPPPAGGAIPVELMAQGPDRGAAQEFGRNPVAWIELRVLRPAQGAPHPGEAIPTVTRVQLPAGTATRYERIDRVGTALEWRFLAFAIETPTGLAYLQIDGTLPGWLARGAEFDHIALLLRTRQGLAPG